MKKQPKWINTHVHCPNCVKGLIYEYLIKSPNNKTYINRVCQFCGKYMSKTLFVQLQQTQDVNEIE